MANPHNFLAEINELLPRCTLKDQRDIKRILNKCRSINQQQMIKLQERALSSVELVEKRLTDSRSISIDHQLPIEGKKDKILETLINHPVVIITGETGSGKTTQLPKICLQASRGIYGRIACTQPRRVAALSVSHRIAEELDVTWGQEVGCKTRFVDETKPQTRIKIMTDGMLLAEIQNDPDLYEYDTIIIDEAHERSLNIDFLLGYLRILLKRRNDLKLIITSATIDTAAFSSAFQNAPIIKVSGRLHPVEIQYMPLHQISSNTEDYTYIDGAIDIVDQILNEHSRGDILVFLPTEKDIHEMRRRMIGRLYKSTDILPLFGRLTTLDQKKVFQPGGNRRIVIGTNIAETSLTIPRIKYVVDTGLARINRYVSRTRTQRLPIENIAKSNARQRAGRCGRVSNGVCIRLYSESDFNKRPEFITPELLRSNLAEVILRMLSLKLGNINAFPFLDPPTPQAIKDGFSLLNELGAIDKKHRLTARGQTMAQLPVTPTLSRMLLQAQEEGVLREILIIASGISIQDPRVRPLDQEKLADIEHNKFVNRTSDFLTLLNIWESFHNTFQHIQRQADMRKFCRYHYLSYNRMREWRDIYIQLRRSLREKGISLGRSVFKSSENYDAIHRSILSGLLSQIAENKDNNSYIGTRNRTAMIFPGSGLFQKKKIDGNKNETLNNPRWIVAAEMVETNRIYARNVARIQPQWIYKLGKHLCQKSYSDPEWNSSAERVLIKEKLHLYGLQVSSHFIDYKKINSEKATTIFIREALINERLQANFKFMDLNREIRKKAEAWLLQNRNAYQIDLDEAAFRFYDDRLDNISSSHDLRKFIKSKNGIELSFFHMTISDLTGVEGINDLLDGFPVNFPLEGDLFPVQYVCQPGSEDDGITVLLPRNKVPLLTPEMIDWLVPGLLCEKIEVLLRGLPRRKRKYLVPIPQTAKSIAAELNPKPCFLTDSLSEYIQSNYNIEILPTDWTENSMPNHLKMRIGITEEDGTFVFATRNLEEIRTKTTNSDVTLESENWLRLVDKWEKRNLVDWSIGDLPERLEIGKTGSTNQYAIPGLDVTEGCVNLRLYRNSYEAFRKTQNGLITLLENHFKKELIGLRNDLSSLRNLPELIKHTGGLKEFQDFSYQHIIKTIFSRNPLYPLSKQRFQEDIKTAHDLLKKIPNWFQEQMERLNTKFSGIIGLDESYPDLKTDIERVLPRNFLEETPTIELPNLVRYLQAIEIRSMRAKENITRDNKKAMLLKPFDQALKEISLIDRADPNLLNEFRWLLEEYRVSVFAQELGTSRSVSPQRLWLLVEQINSNKKVDLS